MVGTTKALNGAGSIGDHTFVGLLKLWLGWQIRHGGFVLVVLNYSNVYGDGGRG